MAGIDESVRQAAQSAETARQYGQIVEQNAQTIRDIEKNLDVILEAPRQAQAASQSAERAAGAVLLLEVVLLTACLPQGGVFGHGDKTPRPEFPGSPMAPAVQIQKSEEQ